LTPGIVTNQNNWKAPVIATKQNAALFADKEQVWADNASSSPFFGHVYVCSGAFRGIPGFSEPLVVSTSTNGGDTWKTKQVTPAATSPTSPQGFGRSGCTVRTDSHGVVYVFAEAFGLGTPGTGYHILVKSFDGGSTWTRPRRLFAVNDACYYVEPSTGRCVEDGVAGARNDLASSPSVDIANGAPTGADATNEIIDSWADGRDGQNHERVMVSYSTDSAQTFTAPSAIETPGDRGYYAAPALSPNGTDAWVVYNAYTTPFRNNTTQSRGLVGVVKHADIAANGQIGAFTEIHRGAVGDPRGSSQNGLQAEFLGDYVYAVATRTFGAGVWNDARNAGVCAAINTYWQQLHDYAAGLTATAPTAPSVQQVCPLNFGNSDIYGGSYPDPTP
ncbi:MAG: glycoside hydrolase, partial [Actinomycetota bacterium]|nr:glycoside hydrolase [Actinomycetota bacterium]